MSCINLGEILQNPQMGVIWIMWPIFTFWGRSHIVGIGEAIQIWCELWYWWVL